jgi:hypothetical protein
MQKWGLGGSRSARTQQGGRSRSAQTSASQCGMSHRNHVIGAIERMDRLHTKLHKLATELRLPAIKALGYETKVAFVQKKLYVLKSYP